MTQGQGRSLQEVRILGKLRFPASFVVDVRMASNLSPLMRGFECNIAATTGDSPMEGTESPPARKVLGMGWVT